MLSSKTVVILAISTASTLSNFGEKRNLKINITASKETISTKENRRYAQDLASKNNSDRQFGATAKLVKFQLTAKFMARKELLVTNLDADPIQVTSKISYNGQKQVNKSGKQGYDPRDRSSDRNFILFSAAQKYAGGKFNSASPM